jgi:hypothetical protein
VRAMRTSRTRRRIDARNPGRETAILVAVYAGTILATGLMTICVLSLLALAGCVEIGALVDSVPDAVRDVGQPDLGAAGSG